MILLWTNTKLSNWIHTANKTKNKAFERLSHLIGNEINITNFSKDWHDGKLYVLLCHCLWPEKFSLSVIQDLPQQRLHSVCDFAKTMGFNVVPFITPKDILNECSDLNLAFLGVFSFNHHIQQQHIPIMEKS